MPPPDLAEDVRQALSTALPGARPTGSRVLSQGAAHRVLELSLDRAPGRVVARLADPAAAPAIDLGRTAAAASLAGRAGVPVPPVVGLRRAGGPGGWDCLLLQHVPGTAWAALRPTAGPAAVAAVHGQVRQVLAALRTVRLGSFGELDTEGRPAGTTLLAALHRRVALRISDPGRRSLMAQVLEREAALFPDTGGAVLVHDDLHAGNLLLTDGPQPALTAVLDWDKAWAGPPDGDLARTAFWDGLPDRGPGDAAGVPERRLQVQQLLWCLEREDDAPRHAADTAQLCRRLGVPPPPG